MTDLLTYWLEVELIECPECLACSYADVYHEVGMPWPILVHTCPCCSYIIMESEWRTIMEVPAQPINPLDFEPITDPMLDEARELRARFQQALVKLWDWRLPSELARAGNPFEQRSQVIDVPIGERAGGVRLVVTRQMHHRHGQVIDVVAIWMKQNMRQPGEVTRIAIQLVGKALRRMIDAEGHQSTVGVHVCFPALQDDLPADCWEPVEIEGHEVQVSDAGEGERWDPTGQLADKATDLAVTIHETLRRGESSDLQLWANVSGEGHFIGQYIAATLRRWHPGPGRVVEYKPETGMLAVLDLGSGADVSLRIDAAHADHEVLAFHELHEAGEMDGDNPLVDCLQCVSRFRGEATAKAIFGE